MRFGIGIFPAAPAEDALRYAQVADQLGYDSVWVGDSHLIWKELYVLLGAMAVSTSRVLLGPCVTNPFTRHLTVTASAMATLSELSRGRARLGLGAGDSALRNLGKKSARLPTLENAILNLKRLFRGESISLEGYPVELAARPSGEIPVYLAAGSPKTQALAGRLADGVVLGYSPDMEKGLAQVRAGENEVARDPGVVGAVLWTPCCVCDDAREALEAVKPQVARRLLSAAARGALSEEELKLTEQLRSNYNFRHHMGPEHATLVPDQLVERYAIAGRPGEVRAKIEPLLALEGIEEIAIIPWGRNPEAVIVSFVRDVISRLRR